MRAKKEIRTKLVVILVIVILAIILSVVLFSTYLVRSFLPSGYFEGTWNGGMTISQTEKDTNHIYQEITGYPREVYLDIEEQSAGYGHIRIRCEGGEPFQDELYPCLFKGKKVRVDDDELMLEGSTVTDHGTQYFDGTFTYHKAESEIVIRGSFSTQKISQVANAYDYETETELK